MSNLGARGGQIITRAGADRSAVRARRGKRFIGGRVRMTEDERRRIILEAAMRLLRGGMMLVELKWHNVAAACDVQTSVMTVRRAFDHSAIALRRAVAEHGRSVGDKAIADEGVRFGFLDAGTA